jgi:hypothetical protein
MNKKILLCCVLISTVTSAKENFIEVGAGYINAQENMIYIKDTKVSNLESSPKKQTNKIPILNLHYNGFFIGKNNALAGIGYNHSFDATLVEVALNSYEVFENPYLLNKDRKRTDAIEVGVSVSKSIFHDLITLSLGYKNITIDDKVTADAQQSSDQLNFDTSFVLIPIEEVITGIGYHFTYNDSKGKSNSYTKHGFSISNITQLTTDYSIASELIYSRFSFDFQNSYFEKKRDENSLSLGVDLTIDNIFNSKDVYFKTELFYSKKSSNIDFFETKYSGVNFSIGYKF